MALSRREVPMSPVYVSAVVAGRMWPLGCVAVSYSTPFDAALGSQRLGSCVCHGVGRALCLYPGACVAASRFHLQQIIAGVARTRDHVRWNSDATWPNQAPSSASPPVVLHDVVPPTSRLPPPLTPSTCDEPPSTTTHPALPAPAHLAVGPAAATPASRPGGAAAWRAVARFRQTLCPSPSAAFPRPALALEVGATGAGFQSSSPVCEGIASA
mmetsp:Transcript_51383/g.120587  ORF Transcript_51383/g.120587 Transcript_51383/m.120587 type:complete len:213 (+) Transcript_51383:331-969(+)